MSASGKQSLVRRVAQALESVLLEVDERIDRAELIGDEDPCRRTRDPRELRDGELGPADVMEDAMAADEIELRIAERQRHHVALP